MKEKSSEQIAIILGREVGGIDSRLEKLGLKEYRNEIKVANSSEPKKAYDINQIRETSPEAYKKSVVPIHE